MLFLKYGSKDCSCRDKASCMWEVCFYAEDSETGVTAVSCSHRYTCEAWHLGLV